MQRSTTAAALAAELAYMLAAALAAAGAAALADVLLGMYNPSGVLPYTVYPESFVHTNSMDDFGMRPNAATGSTGRTGTGRRVDW